MSAECKDFLSKILNKDPKERLGAKNGVQEILEHPWFKDLDPQKMENKKLKP
jgi:serine/threonine protein kinase